MKHLISAVALLACLIIPTAINSTCIVILKTGNAIYVVADTRSSTTLGSKKKGFVKGTATINKIGHVGYYYFALAGHDDQHLMSYALEIDSIRPLSYNVSSFCEKMKKRYLDLMRWEKNNMPGTYNYYLANVLSSVAFFTNTSGKPILITADFNMQEVNGTPQITYETSESLRFVTLGVRDHIDKITDAESQCYRKGVEGMVELVRLEAANHPDGIGCPFDILTWTSKPIITRRNCN